MRSPLAARRTSHRCEALRRLGEAPDASCGAITRIYYADRHTM